MRPAESAPKVKRGAKRIPSHTHAQQHPQPYAREGLTWRERQHPTMCVLKVRGIIIHLKEEEKKTLHKHFSGCNFQSKDTFPSRNQQLRGNHLVFISAKSYPDSPALASFSELAVSVLQSFTQRLCKHVFEQEP